VPLFIEMEQYLIKIGPVRPRTTLGKRKDTLIDLTGNSENEATAPKKIKVGHEHRKTVRVCCNA